jgi:hypothetical protein
VTTNNGLERLDRQQVDRERRGVVLHSLVPRPVRWGWRWGGRRRRPFRQLGDHGFERGIDLAHPRRVAAVIRMELGGQPAPRHTNLFQRRVRANAQHGERIVHVEFGCAADRSSA